MTARNLWWQARSLGLLPRVRRAVRVDCRWSAATLYRSRRRAGLSRPEALLLAIVACGWEEPARRAELVLDAAQGRRRA